MILSKNQPHSLWCFPVVLVLQLLLALLLLGLGAGIGMASVYENPVQSLIDSPDPGVLWWQEDKLYYMVTTDNNSSKSSYIPIWSSLDGATWKQIGYAMLPQDKPQWMSNSSSDHWAPELHLVNGQVNIYYAARNSRGVLCIGVGTSTSAHPLGPYVHSNTPLFSAAGGLAPPGAIDPTVVWMDGTPYLVYKLDGNDVGIATPIIAIALSPNGTYIPDTASGVQLITNDQPWEANLVEAPWIISPSIYGGRYWYLFYSANNYGSPSYAVGVARALSPIGPYEKFSGNPILHTKQPEDSGSLEGPGHCSVIATPSEEGLMVVYHAWPHGQAGKTYRVLMLDAMTISDDEWPNIAGGAPSEGQQPIPAQQQLH